MDEQLSKNLIGKRIKERRTELEMSQLELAKHAEKESATYIALIENGDRNVSTADLIKIAEALGTSVSFLTGEEEKAAPDIKYALKADKSLSIEDKKILFHLINRMKEGQKDSPSVDDSL
ncbi:MAG: helix-turn-helix transcriptional regulator [Candidatus Peribacteraceae bacterium]|nr:helix-turn-helix transcriptional regulator [Candidatus Peribacteraceae bacterium]MDD5739296.1 helix-turn-helix transcriptional regulator [Candidatus Peribacteraceae bacterium]